jgi:hypothetical protein
MHDNDLLESQEVLERERPVDIPEVGIGRVAIGVRVEIHDKKSSLPALQAQLLFRNVAFEPVDHKQVHLLQMVVALQHPEHEEQLVPVLVDAGVFEHVAAHLRQV